MDTKLASLIDRLEAVVKRAESASSGSQAVQSAPASSAPGSQNAFVKEWQQDVVSQVKPFLEAAAALNVAQVTVVTQQFVSLVHLQSAVFLTMAKFAQPADFSFLTAKNVEVINAASLVKQKDFKSPPNHMQTVIDGMQMFSYPFFEGDALKESIKDFFEQISFYGNKVLSLGKDQDSKWYNAFKDLNSAILGFVLKKLGSISKWSGKEDQSGAAAYFNSIADACMKGETPSDGASSSSAAAKDAAPVEQAKPVASGN